METHKLISIDQYCTHNKIEFSFIESLNEFGLIEIITYQNDNFLQINQLRDIERMSRLHYELNINLEGLDAISNLLNKVEHLEQELNGLKDRLKLYEDDFY